MQTMDDYVQILRESLIKKSELLDTLIRKNKSQTECIEGKAFEDIDWDAFNLLMTEKEFAIDRINKMDEGFQSLFDRIKDQLEPNKSKYANEIKEIQALITKITDQGVEIRTGEERNRQLIDKIMMDRKSTIRKSRNSLKVAQSYMNTMHGDIVIDDVSTINRKK